MLGEPDEVEPERVEPRDLLEDLRVEARHRDAGVRRIAEVVDHAESKGKDHGGMVRAFDADSARGLCSPRDVGPSSARCFLLHHHEIVIVRIVVDRDIDVRDAAEVPRAKRDDILEALANGSPST
jgi:hypothetical protein